MAYYRIYGLDPAGRIAFGDHFECRDDDHAMDVARGMLSRFPAVEVWEQARRLGAVLPEIALPTALPEPLAPEPSQDCSKTVN